MNGQLCTSVWPVAQQPARVQRQDRYLPDSTAHPGKMLPDLARHAIRSYSEPGDLVLDPMCGIGTTLVEAVQLGRRAVGVELERRWGALAAANLTLARHQGATGRGLALEGDARRLARGLLDEFAGQARLILTSPPYGSSLHGQVRAGVTGVDKYDDRYSRNPDNIAELPARRGRADRSSFADALAEVFAGCGRMLAPDGLLVMTARPYRRHGELIDLPGQLEALAPQAGLEPFDRLVALLCALRGQQLVPRASFFQLRHQRAGTIPRMLLIAHEDVLVFRKTTSSASSRKLKGGQREPKCSDGSSASVDARVRGEARERAA